MERFWCSCPSCHPTAYKHLHVPKTGQEDFTAKKWVLYADFTSAEPLKLAVMMVDSISCSSDSRNMLQQSLGEAPSPPSPPCASTASCLGFRWEARRRLQASQGHGDVGRAGFFPVRNVRGWHPEPAGLPMHRIALPARVVHPSAAFCLAPFCSPLCFYFYYFFSLGVKPF